MVLCSVHKGQAAHRSKEEGDNNKPDDVILKGCEGLLEAESLGEDSHCD